MPLTALIHGSGFAGQGHAQALRDCGVEVVGMVSRTESVVKQVAEEMDIPYASTDWQHALDTLKPDIVAIGTPGGAHYEPIMAALALGCHIYCDKPLTATAEQARALYDMAESTGVKTAYAASYRYQPAALYARELVAHGAIGEPQEVECISHYNLNPLIPFGWSHRIGQGGGRLNNNFTHKLSIVQHVLNGEILRATGEVRDDMHRAPMVSGVHDFRTREDFAPEDDDALAQLEWAENDAEWSYTVMMRLGSYFAEQPVSALFKHGGLQPRFHEDYVAFYGSEAAIYIKEAYAQGPLYIRRRSGEGEWEQQAIPQHITDALPRIEDDTQRNWTQLAREFVADIHGEGYSGYQTFRHGWIYQAIIAAVRSSTVWEAPSG